MIPALLALASVILLAACGSVPVSSRSGYDATDQDLDRTDKEKADLERRRQEQIEKSYQPMSGGINVPFVTSNRR